jgi:hypothetical protein
MAHDQEVVGSNPGTGYWMDISDVSYNILENNEKREPNWAHQNNI